MNVSLQILIIWIVAIIASTSMDLMLYFRIFKDIADAGYKFTDKRLQNENQQIDPKVKENIKSRFLLKKMIPIYNLFKSCEMILEYVKSRDTVLNYFYVMDELE